MAGYGDVASRKGTRPRALNIREVNAAAGTRGPTDRWAFRCFTGASSDVILGHGWAARGYSAADIDPATVDEDLAVELLRRELGCIPLAGAAAVGPADRDDVDGLTGD